MAPTQSNPRGPQRGTTATRLFSFATVTAGLLIAANVWDCQPVRADPPEPAIVEGKPFTDQIPGTTVKFDMLPIPGGKFQMGSPAEEKKRKDDEGPQFQVQVDPFWMGKYTVTWAEYNVFLQNYYRMAKAENAPKIPTDKAADVVTYPTPMYELDAGPVLDRMGRGDRYPAVIMSQLAARQYTKWLSKKTGHFYRLPTEAEWEYACRAGTTTAYSFGDDRKQLKEYAWYFDNSALADGDGAYHEVGLKKPNPWGLFDMHGNVAQWCIDQYAADWYKHFDGKSVAEAEAINWPTTQYPRAIRGGSWNSEAEECRSASRYGSDAKLNLRDPQIPKSPHWLTEGFWIGFRIISPVKEPPEGEKNKWWEPEDDATKTVLQRDREMHEIVRPGPDEPEKSTPGK